MHALAILTAAECGLLLILCAAFTRNIPAAIVMIAAGVAILLSLP
jgi:hypothetical protein